MIVSLIQKILSRRPQWFLGCEEHTGRWHLEIHTQNSRICLETMIPGEIIQFAEDQAGLAQQVWPQMVNLGVDRQLVISQLKKIQADAQTYPGDYVPSSVIDKI